MVDFASRIDPRRARMARIEKLARQLERADFVSASRLFSHVEKAWESLRDDDSHNSDAWLRGAVIIARQSVS
jgi:hypothetical protein